MKAAVRYNNKIFTGWSHADILMTHNEIDADDAEQGFIHNESFYNRVDAMKIAISNKLIDEDYYSCYALSSWMLK